MDDVTITEARRDMPALIRQIEADPENVSFGITVNGRRAAILASPTQPTSSTSGWIESRGLTRDRLPVDIRDLLSDDNRGEATVWIHVQTGAFLALVPQGNWNEGGQPAAFYIPPDRVNRVELTWALGNWDGSSPVHYHDVLDDARRYIARRLAML